MQFYVCLKQGEKTFEITSRALGKRRATFLPFLHREGGNFLLDSSKSY